MSTYTEQHADAELAASHAETNVVNHAHRPEPPTIVSDEVAQELIYMRRNLRQFQEYYETHGHLFEQVVAALPGPLDNYTFNPCNGSFDIRIATGRDTLGEIVRVLRSTGFKPNVRPSEGDTDWSTYWVHPSEAQIWFAFSSTQCKRVQVGTETKQVPVYETQCDDNLLEDFVC